MKTNLISRRQFIRTTTAAGALAVISSPLPAQGTTPRMTVRDLIALMKTKHGVTWNEESYRDTVKAGNIDTPVTGVASTFMATLDVIQQAKAAGTNFVVTHEPTFWSDPDTITDHVLDDPLYALKRDFVEKNNMVVWRNHDHWHLFRPDPFSTYQNKALGWEQYAATPGARLYKFPPTPVKVLARQIATRLESRSVRIVGDPEQVVTTVARGGHQLDQNIRALAGEVDAIVVSEAREVDSIEYVRDLNASGTSKPMILVSHQTGEEAGMTAFAEWLPTIVPGLKVVNIKTRDLMWIP
jgi:putative NIF3 family GTP cyclohydrolase 1 type 2